MTGGHQVEKGGLSLVGDDVRDVKGKDVSTKCTCRESKTREDVGSRHKKALS